jgi:hypothetical protein
MKSFFEWFETENIDKSRSWLILGKGPTFSLRGAYDLSRFRTLSLNHACREESVFVAHVIDVEVIEDLGNTLLDKCQYLVMPWVPHIRYGRHHIRRKFGPSHLDLPDYCARIPVLKQLATEGRLLWYNLATSPRTPQPGCPSVPVFAFSATAALNLLAMAGVKHVRSLGVDGGRTYSESFDDLKEKTLLAAGLKSFDLQFEEIARTIMTTGIDFAPLHIDSPMKVYVGTEIEQMLPMKVLEYSICKHMSMSADIVPLHKALSEAGIPIPTLTNRKHWPRTPFSFQRFAIPALNGYKGRAIYLDSDMQVFRDIKELWMWPFGDAQILAAREPAGSGRRSQFSVMVMNCERLDWDVEKLVRRMDEEDWSYEDLVYHMKPAEAISQSLPSEWNDLERYSERRTALTHYTDMKWQPWLSTENILGAVWCRDLFEAIRNDFISMDFVREQVQRGWVRPSLLYQLEKGIVDPLFIPRSVVRKDVLGFIAPDAEKVFWERVTLHGRLPNAVGRYTRLPYAVARHLWNESGAARFARRVKRRFS